MVSSLVGVVSHAYLHHIVWLPAIAIGCGAMVGAQIGARLSSKSRPRVIIVILSAGMFILGGQFIYRGIFSRANQCEKKRLLSHVLGGVFNSCQHNVWQQKAQYVLLVRKKIVV